MTKLKREELANSSRSLGQDAWDRLCQNRMAQIGGITFFVILLLCLFVPFFSGQSYQSTDLSYGAHGPSLQHWFGTDDLGRDLFIRTLIGGRISIGVGFAATAVALLIGVSYGMLAGYFGGKTETIMMRFVDTMYALPFTLIVILLTVFIGKSLILIFLAIGAVEWLTMARIVRGQTQALRKQTFVAAATVSGARSGRILIRHILPNLLGPVIVYTTLTIPAVILLESVISFLGLGVQPPMSSWGILINDGAEKLDVYPWMLIFPAIFFSLTIFSLNFMGDGLRDALDPKEVGR
ncbi:ABC transporter permease [Coraliomargarita parva]|uniref:ABC transporter permease n=1 Tax=Coraliomargarita parva TaxID=3014050 RepID=UPI0022B54B6F|nr:ABC transporter permease subunit [Coraliomargarita parva]